MDFFKKNIWNLVILLLLGVNLVLNGRFVQKDEYISDRERLTQAIVDLESTVRVMEERNKINDLQDSRIGDHESRLRKLEQAR